MSETGATSLSQILIPTQTAASHTNGKSRNSQDRPKRAESAQEGRGPDGSQDSRYQDEKAAQIDHSENQSRTQEDRGSQAEVRDRKEVSEKPFEKAVRQASQSGKKKESRETQEQAGAAVMSLQDIVKSPNDSERPTIHLKKISAHAQQGQGKALSPDGSASAQLSKEGKGKDLLGTDLEGKIVKEAKVTEETGAEAGKESTKASSQGVKAAARDLLAESAGKAVQDSGERTPANVAEAAGQGQKAASQAVNTDKQAVAGGLGQAQLRSRQVSGQEAEATRPGRGEDAPTVQDSCQETVVRTVTDNAIQAPGQVGTQQDAASRLGSHIESDGFQIDQDSLDSVNATVTTRRPAVGTQGPGSAAQGHDPEVAQSVVRQVTQYMRTQRMRSGDEMVLRLDPPELGSVKMTLRGSGGELRMAVEAGDARTLTDLQREAPALLQRLNDSGIEVRRVEFAQSDPSGSGGSFGSLNRQGTQGQGEFEQDDAPGPSASSTRAQDAGVEQESPQSPANVVADDAINLWM
jgi:flagellar hook-length control protein FliK